MFSSSQTIHPDCDGAFDTRACHIFDDLGKLNTGRRVELKRPRPSDEISLWRSKLGV